MWWTDAELMLCRLQTTCWRSFCMANSWQILCRQSLNSERMPKVKKWKKKRLAISSVAVLSLVCTADLQELLHLQFLFLYDTWEEARRNIKWVSHKSSYFFFAVVVFQPFVAWAMTSNLFAKCHGLFFSKSVLRSNFSIFENRVCARVSAKQVLHNDSIYQLRMAGY